MNEALRMIITIIVSGTINIALIGAGIYVLVKLTKKRKEQIELRRKINTENYLNLKKIAEYVEKEKNKKD